MYDICALGEVLIDAIASADTCIQITGNAGGAPANVLTCGTGMGLKTAFLAKAGGDFIGNWLKGVLDEVGIDTAGMILDPSKNTTIAMVSLDEAGNRSFSFYRIGCADVSLTKEELRLDLIEQSRIFHFGSVSMTEEPARSATLAAARYAREKGLLVSYDPNLRRNLWCDEQTAAKYIKEGLTLCDVAKLSDEECRFLYGDQDIPSQGRQMLRDYPSLRLLFVTCGGAGSYVFCGDQMQYAPGYSVKVADTTGAGDTFMGAVLYQLLQHGGADWSSAELQSLLRFGNAASALSVQRFGAIPAIPGKADVEAFLAEHPAPEGSGQTLHTPA